MPRYEPPLTDAERAELQRIRHNRQVKNARREIQNANYYQGTGKAIFGLVAAFLFVCWPFLVWHQPDEAGNIGAPTTTAWVVWGIQMGVLVVPIAALIVWGMYSKDTGKTRPARTPEERAEREHELSELRAEALARNGVALSAIADPAMRKRVAEIRAANASRPSGS
jgi:hypothetical protein